MMLFSAEAILASSTSKNSALIVRMKPPITLVESILVGSNGGYDLHPQEHPIFGKVLRLDYFQSFDDGILDLV